ncbi:MAG TPA: malate dehydrogenase, partial [Cytophagales bacterium]|nr:malate dehydrogenase [Cytophagales bacterium]
PPFVSFLPLAPDPVGEGLGHFLGAMRVDAFRPLEEWQQHIDNWIRRFRNSTPAPGQERVLIPGDPEREMEALREKEGIPLLDAVVKDLTAVGDKFGIKLPDH